MGPFEFITAITFVLGLLSSAGVQFARNRTATLVLQKFHTSDRPQPARSPSVEIVGRMQGLMAFTLTLMGFSPVIRFTIAGDELRCESTSLFGQRFQFIPLNCVSTMAAGIYKPIAALIWAAVVTVVGFSLSLEMRSWIPLVVGIPSGIALVILYVISKKFFLEVHAQGGPPISLMFRPNVLEGVPIDVNRALEIVSIIRDRIMEAGSGRARSVPNGDNDAADDMIESPRDYQPADYEASAWATTDSPNDAERQAAQLLDRARECAKNGDRERAVEILQELVRRFPDTEIAQQARRHLQRRGQ